MNSTENDRFLEELFKIVKDRGNCAALRHYWSETTRYQSYPLLGQLGALHDERKTILTALYAEHPHHEIGKTLGKAALALGKRTGDEHPFDRHFRRLLACDDITDLAQQLHRLVRRLKREGIGLDYSGLYKDLNFWANHCEKVKVNWAADFWEAPSPEGKKKEAAP